MQLLELVLCFCLGLGCLREKTLEGGHAQQIPMTVADRSSLSGAYILHQTNGGVNASTRNERDKQAETSISNLNQSALNTNLPFRLDQTSKKQSPVLHQSQQDVHTTDLELVTHLYITLAGLYISPSLNPLKEKMVSFKKWLR